LLGYHYYTELAHSAGMSKEHLENRADPRERIRAVMYWMTFFDNTVQYQWFIEIARAFLNYQSERLSLADCTWLCDTAERLMASPDWEEQVLRRSHIEKVFLTNDFDDPLEGFDTSRYVPCLRTDDLVFRLNDPEVRQRLEKAANVEVVDAASLRRALAARFDHFTRKGARACAISLPPEFAPEPIPESLLSAKLAGTVSCETPEERTLCSYGIFWMLAELCREYRLPFDLMIGVNRRVYEQGVYQGQDLFDQRTSLVQYRRLFNEFPQVTFCISVLSHGQNQELASYSWIFPNVITSGHWWYSNIPAYIELDARARLQAVPKTKQLGYYSDMYKLEFGLPKYNMYRRILANILVNDFVRTRVYTESQALELARLLLRDNARRIFNV
jgi:glucuronate isomerase